MGASTYGRPVAKAKEEELSPTWKARMNPCPFARQGVSSRSPEDVVGKRGEGKRIPCLVPIRNCVRVSEEKANREKGPGASRSVGGTRTREAT